MYVYGMTHPFEPDKPLFTVEIAALGSRASAPLLRKWQAAGLLNLREVDLPGARGRSNFTRLSWRTTLRVAVMVEITRWGIPANMALETAMSFTDAGGPPLPPHGDETDEERRNRIAFGPRYRNPGEPFHEGETWLVFTNRTQPGRLENVRADRPFVSPRLPPESSLLIIDCRTLIDRVAFALQAAAAGEKKPAVLEKVD